MGVIILVTLANFGEHMVAQMLKCQSAEHFINVIVQNHMVGTAL